MRFSRILHRPFANCSPRCDEAGNQNERTPPPDSPDVCFCFDSVRVLPTEKKQPPPPLYIVCASDIRSIVLFLLSYIYSPLVIDLIVVSSFSLLACFLRSVESIAKISTARATQQNKAQPVSHTRRASDSTSSEFTARITFALDVSLASLLTPPARRRRSREPPRKEPRGRAPSFFHKQVQPRSAPSALLSASCFLKFFFFPFSSSLSY